MRIVFFGTSSFAAKILEFLIQKKIFPIAIVTQPDKAKNRSSKLIFTPVKEVASKHLISVPIFQPEKASNATFVQKIRELTPDLFIVVAYGQILSKDLLDLPKVAPINIHASSLPKYRGAAPIQRCLMAGEKSTGITIIKMNVNMDAGEMIVHQELSIDPNMTFGELEKKLIYISCSLLSQTLDQFQDQTVQYFPQDIDKVTFAPKISKKELQIDWSKSAYQIHNLIRALSPKPGAWCVVKINGKETRVKILLSECLDQTYSPGKVIQENPLIIGCAKGSIKVLLVQPEGKKVMNSLEWLRGMQRKNFTFVY